MVSGEESKKERDEEKGGRAGRKKRETMVNSAMCSKECHLKNATSIKKMLHQHVVIH